MAFYRRPSPLELTYIAQDTPLYSPFVNQYFTEGVGDLDEDTLRNAVHDVAKVMAEARMLLKGFWGFRYWDDNGPLPLVRSIDASLWDGLSCENFRIFEAPMNVRVGPLFEVLLLEGNPRRILFRTHHGCTDGAGTIYFVRQVFRVLRGESIQPITSRFTEWDIALKEGPILKEVTSGNCKPVFRNPKKEFEPGCVWRRFTYPGKPAGIGGKIMSIVAQWANEQGLDRLVFRVPADLRRYMPKGEFSASNCTSVLDIEAKDVKAPQKLQQLIIASMRNKQDIAWINPINKWLPWMPMAVFRSSDKRKKLIHERGTYGFTCMTTNMGQFNLSDFSCKYFNCISIFGTPISLEFAPLYISFYQSAQGTGITICIPRSLGTDEDLKMLYTKIAKGLDDIEMKTKLAME